jgi:dTDP-4-amino-4,6-dideoxygalactose transaminase
MPDITERFEKEFALGAGADHAVAFGYARHALVAILAAAGLRAGDEIIVSPLTCKVVPLALLSLGLRPVYTDISGTTLNLNPARVEAAISPATRAILFQHTYGHAGGVEEVAALAQQHKLLLVEDCAQCMPTRDNGYHPGRHGNCTIFSNNPGKPLPAASGGMAVTQDAALADAIRALRDRLPSRGLRGEIGLSAEAWLHRYVLRPSLYWLLFDLHRRVSGKAAPGSLEEEIADEITGSAFRASPRQVRLGRKWMQEIPALATHRRACCAAYAKALDETAHITRPIAAGTAPLYYYPVLVERKPELLKRARRLRVEIIPWPIAAPIYPLEDVQAMSMFGYRPGDCPVAESIATRLVGLPTHDKVTPGVREKVIALLQSHATTQAEAV